MDRREFLVWAAAVAALATLPGCATPPDGMAVAPEPAPMTVRPGTPRYPTAMASLPPQPATVYVPAATRPVYGAPQPGIVMSRPAAGTVYAPAPAPVYAPATTVRPAMPPAPAAPMPSYAAAAGGQVAAISRSSWQALPPINGKCTPMNGVTRITVHHEGNPKPNNDVTPAQVAATLKLIQKEHRARMNAADIGYHYIIDRTGRVWQGREECFQGAHVSGNNSNNLGVLVLGNFNIQQPTPQQLATLDRLLRQLMRVHRVPKNRVYCHGELGNTKCPGDNLRMQFVAMRQRL